MRIIWVATLVAISTRNQAAGQGTSQFVSVNAVCLEVNQTVMSLMAKGKFAEAELAVPAILIPGDDHAQDVCAGLVLNNMAAFRSISGGIADAEKLAERSVAILEKAYSSTDPALLRPLQILAATRFELGMMTKAREAFKAMQSIRLQRPADRALVYGMAAVFLDAEGKLPEAEVSYVAALQAWEDAGRGRSSDAGATLNGLGSLYIKEGRLNDARRALDRALAIFNSANDFVPMDRIKLLHVRGVLQARQNDWREAEQDLHNALSMADREPKVDPVVLQSVLIDYAMVLRKTHRRRDARSIEARSNALRADLPPAAIVDIADLLPKAKSAKK